ncbi:MAG: orotate phosphoribosyltransferase [Planctomycetota bacterium]
MTLQTEFDRDGLITAIKQQALKIGNFTLASGKQAKYYLDCRQVTLDSRTATIVADGMLATIFARYRPVAVGGMAVGAVPITAAMLARAEPMGHALRGFFVRKEAKQHGAGRQIEGPVQEGDDVVVVEDVVTTGGSALQAIDACQEFGLQVAGVVAIVDRLEGGREAFAARGIELTTLLTVDDLGVER